MAKFHSHDVWKTIKALCKKSKRAKVAVAFFGKGGAKLLPLKGGDTLIVAMDKASVAAGLVCPDDIQQLHNKGVHIFTVKNLHAKVCLFDDKAVVGSANISGRSAKLLIEAAIVTDEKNVVREIDQFIRSLTVERVHQDFIALCQTYYRPPVFPDPLPGRGSNPPKVSKLHPVWVISTCQNNEDADDLATFEKYHVHYESKILQKFRFKLDYLVYPLSGRFAQQIRKGDQLIQIFHRGARADVYGPIWVLGVELDQKSGRAYVWIEERKKPKTLVWTTFERALRRSGVQGITKWSTREIKNWQTKSILLKCFH